MPAVSVPIMDSISTGALETMTLRLKCTNGHDRCYLGPDEDCPYCERVPRTPVNVDDDLHRVLKEALGPCAGKVKREGR